MPRRIETLLQQTTFLLTQHQSPSAKIDATVLLCHVLDKPSSYLYTWPDNCLTEQQFNDFSQLVERRKAGEPVAYIIGFRDFWSLRLRVEPTSLIPRPDTECLVEFALERLINKSARVLDLGTGSGAIALSLAKERPDIEVIGVDFRQDVVNLAQRNALENGITNAHFIQSNWFDALPVQTFSMIVSNPPYIDANDPHLMQGDVRFEPKSALVADEQGLADIRQICQQSSRYLDDKGWLLIEHGFAQGDAVRALFCDMNFCDVTTLKDHCGHDRVTLGCLSQAI